MEVVAPHHPQITTRSNPPICMFTLNVDNSEDPTTNQTDLKDSTSKSNIEVNYSLEDEEKTEILKCPDDQEDEDIIGNSEGAQSCLSDNAFESPAVKSEKPSQNDLKQINFLLKGLPALGQIFNLHQKIGEGTFSSVFLATLRGIQSNSQFATKQFAVKHLIPTTHPSRAERELKCLQEIGGKDNVVGVHLCLRNADFIAFVMPYLPHRRFSEYVLDMGIEETRLYMRNLLLALCRVHSFNIIHRDVKPSNFLYNRQTKQFLLVDFGLSQPVEETAPPKLVSPESVSVTKKRKRCEESEGIGSAGVGGASGKHFSQTGSSENVAKRRALQPCNNNTLNIMKTPEKGPRYHPDTKFASSMSSARARNLQNITNFGSNSSSHKPSFGSRNLGNSPPKEPAENNSTRITPRKTRSLAGENLMKSPVKSFEKNTTFGSTDIWKDKRDENSSRAKFAAGFSKIKADLEARRTGQREPPQRKILFDDFPDPKPSASKLMTESRSAAILRRSLQGDNPVKFPEPSRLAADIIASVKSPKGPTLQEKIRDSKSILNGREFRTLVSESTKDPFPGSSIVRVQNSQVKSQQKSPVTPSESRKLLMQSSREKVVFAKPHAPLPAASTSHCTCFGKPQVCTNCLTRKPQGAPRAGTPGFRPPEVLLRSPVQTTAVDMWAAGVILLCILSGCYPFFRSPDDLTALAEIMTVFGTSNIKEIAKRLGRLVVCSQPSKALDLKKLCIRMRQRRKDRANVEEGAKCPNCCQVIYPETGCICRTDDINPQNVQPGDVNNETKNDAFPDTAYHLLARLLDLNPESRITAAEALTHPFVHVRQ